MKTKTVERLLMSGRHEPHRSELAIVTPREAFDAIVVPLLSGRWSIRHVGCDARRCTITVKVFDREGLHASARMVRRALVALRRAGHPVRVVTPAARYRDGWYIPARLPRRAL